MKRLAAGLCLMAILFLTACTGKGTPSTSTVHAVSTIEPERVITQVVTQLVVVTPTPEPTPSPLPTPVPPEPKIKSVPGVNYRIWGLTFEPVSDTEPNRDTTADIEKLYELISDLAPYTETIRIPWCGGGMDKAAMIAHDMGLGVFAEARIGKDITVNNAEMDCLINLTNGGYADVAIIGDGTLTRGDLTEDQLIGYFKKFRSAAPYVAIISPEPWQSVGQYPALIAAETVVGVTFNPAGEGIPLEKSAAEFETWYVNFHSYLSAVGQNKDIVVIGTGWPSCGKNGSPPKAAFYLGGFTSMARANNLLFYFDAFDEPYKAKGGSVEAGCMGLWDAERNLKPGMALTFTGIIGGEGNPEVGITYLPPLEAPYDLQGYATHVIPADYRIVVYIKVPDQGWWIKPTTEDPFTEITDSGQWRCSCFIAGNDDRATDIAVFLVPKTYRPPVITGGDEIPKEVYDNSVATVTEHR